MSKIEIRFPKFYKGKPFLSEKAGIYMSVLKVPNIEKDDERPLRTIVVPTYLIEKESDNVLKMTIDDDSSFNTRRTYPKEKDAEGNVVEWETEDCETLTAKELSALYKAEYFSYLNSLDSEEEANE